MDGQPCEITVDTGSNISIVRPDILSEEQRERVRPVNCSLRTVTGEKAPIHGRSKLHLEIGTMKLPHELWIADIHDECILGLDFLQRHDCQVNLKGGSLIIGEEEVPLKQSTPITPRCRKVTLTEGVCLPPLTEMVVPVRMERDVLFSSWGLLEPVDVPRFCEGVLVARTLVDLREDRVPLRVMNLTEQEQRLDKGTQLANCVSVASIENASSVVARRVEKCQVPVTLPPHLKDLYDRSVAGLDGDESTRIYQLLVEFSDVFSKGTHDLGSTDLVKHHINTGDAAPIRQAPRRLPLAKKEEAARAVGEMREQGVIEPSASPWSSPIVLVNKKDGSTRFCVDYRRLNNVTHKDSYPLPRIDDTIEAMAGVSWFSTLDLKSGYWQVPLDDSSKEKTAFSTGNGLWQFKVMPFGLCNAPATFERLMEQVLFGLPMSVALVYLDDILVPGRSFEAQLANLKLVFERLRKAKLKLSPKKCFLFRREVKYLGHVVNEEGISPDLSKIEAVTLWPTPTSATEVKSFLGLCSYYRRFVPSFADVARPLHRSADGSPFQWTQETEGAFQELKKALTEAPILAYPNPDAKFVLDTDASGTGIGAVLSQRCPSEEREVVVAYFSKALSIQERRYCVTRRELLAMVKAIKHFHVYLYGRKFLLRTDHSALRWLLNFRQPEGQVARWIETLQQYDFDIEHRPGVSHGNADSLSRRPCLQDSCKHCERLDTHETVALPVKVTRIQVSSATSLSFSDEETSGGSSGEIRDAQLDDEDIKPVLQWMDAHTDKPTWEEVSKYGHGTKIYFSQWQSLSQCNGVLYRLWESPSGDVIIKQLVLPKIWRKDVLQELHNTRTAGHLGVAKTLSRVRERFYWVQCRRDVQQWCRDCDLCAQKRGPQKKIRAPMRQYNVGSPMDRIAIDILGPLPVTEAGNKYILIAADYFTKWVEAFSLPNQEARTIADVLVKEFVCRFGVPLSIHSDQGRNFESALFAEICHLMGIKKTRTTPYHPQSDGMVERFNRTLEMELSKFAEHQQKDWDEHIPFLMMAYRSAVHSTTGCSPAKMMLGRELKLPVDLIFGRPEEEILQTPVEYVLTLQERLERVHGFARAHLREMSNKMKDRYDTLLEGQLLDVGDAVWLHNPQRKKGLSPKLQRPWEGPYIVTKVINDSVYRIQLGAKTKPKVVHRNRLWSYSGSNVPTWYRRTACPNLTVQEH